MSDMCENDGALEGIKDLWQIHNYHTLTRVQKTPSFS